MPLSNEAIQDAVERYEREHDRYVKLAEVVYERCLQIVEEKGLRATVQRRTKKPSSLRKKLLKISRKNPPDPRFDTLEGVFVNMGDLAAVRVGTYLESDRATVVEELKRAFEFLPGTAEHQNPDVKNKSGRAQHYRAIHCQVQLKGEDAANPKNTNITTTSCEIQVCSMLAHVWNEIEHDLGYKPETADLSEREKSCLEALGQLARAGDELIKTLLDANRERVAEADTRFGSQFDFMARMQKFFSAATNFHEHAAQLYDVLLQLDLDSPTKIKDALLLDNDYQQRATDLLTKLRAHINDSGDEVVSVEPATSDQLVVLLLDKRLDDVLGLYPTGRGMGRPRRIVSLAKRFEAMKAAPAVGDGAAPVGLVPEAPRT
jgi:ppGpp synthetase/RelA/SpoT-type nucleotidyltranferase